MKKCGLFLCRAECIDFESVDVDSLAREYPNLAAVAVYDNLHHQAAMEDILSQVRANSLEAVVLAGCSNQYYKNTLGGDTLINRLVETGINPNCISFANLREQCALPHKEELGKATKKARFMIDVALEKVRLSQPLETAEISPHRSVLVIGTTPGGIIAAYQLIEKDYKVTLVDNVTELRKRHDWISDLQPALACIQTSPDSHILLETEVVDLSGWCGDYTVSLEREGKKQNVTVGGIIIAIGDDIEWTKKLHPLLHIDLDLKGHFRSRNPHTFAAKTTDEGICLIPKPEGLITLKSETDGATAAVSAITTLLDRREIFHPITVSEVDRTICGACGTCVKTCAYNACSLDMFERVSVVDPRRCKGCGNCVAACPTGARDLVTYPNQYIINGIEIYSRCPRLDTVKVLMFLCNGCAYPAADNAGMAGFSYPVSVLPLGVECGGRVDTQYILEGFRFGFDGILLGRCREGHCHNIVGHTYMDRRINLFREVIRSRGLDSERVRFLDVSPHEGKLFAREVNQFVDDLKKMGGNV